jgi:release factor glutamine methyltransferase
VSLGCLKIGEERLLKSHKSPQEISYILKDIFSCTPRELVLGKKGLNEELFKTIVSLRERDIPLSYLTRKVNFFGLTLNIKPGVFTPRPETEILVEVVLKKASLLKGEKRILDIGVGSGAISLALAAKLDDAIVVGTDIDELSVEVAEENARKLSLESRCFFFQTDLFPRENMSFDIIVSNPPYIPSWQIPFLPREVSQFEPRKALDGGKDGLLFYRRIAEKVPRYLKNGGFLAVEVGQGEADEVSKIFASFFERIEIFSDFNEIERVVVAS